MSSSKERVFVIGANADIGGGVVRGLVKKGIDTTAYIRDEKRAKDSFKNELNTGHLTIAVGTYTSTEIFTKAIQGHTRLFLIVTDTFDKPAFMSEVKGNLAKIAYENGVRQILDLSSISVSTEGTEGTIGYAHTTSEEKLRAIADANSEQYSLVIFRPGSFMNNHLKFDFDSIKYSNKIISCGSPSSAFTWIDTKDISDCAVTVLSDPIKKHDRLVYEMGAEILSNEQRAAIFSKVLGRRITYEQKSIGDFYKTWISVGMSHSFTYTFISYIMNGKVEVTTPQLALLLDRPLRTLEEWLKENIKAFEQ